MCACDYVCQHTCQFYICDDKEQFARLFSAFTMYVLEDIKLIHKQLYWLKHLTGPALVSVEICIFTYIKFSRIMCTLHAIYKNYWIRDCGDDSVDKILFLQSSVLLFESASLKQNPLSCDDCPSVISVLKRHRQEFPSATWLPRLAHLESYKLCERFCLNK